MTTPYAFLAALYLALTSFGGAPSDYMAVVPIMPPPIVDNTTTNTPTDTQNDYIDEPNDYVDTSSWHELTVTVSAYCPCAKCNGQWAGQPTASGTELTVGRTIAVDPRVIPLGALVEIDGHIYVAEDTGVSGAWIDLLMATHEEALEWGLKTKTVRWKK